MDQSGKNVSVFNESDTVSLQEYNIYSRDIDDFSFCGPYLRLGIGF